MTVFLLQEVYGSFEFLGRQGVDGFFAYEGLFMNLKRRTTFLIRNETEHFILVTPPYNQANCLLSKSTTETRFLFVNLVNKTLSLLINIQKRFLVNQDVNVIGTLVLKSSSSQKSTPKKSSASGHWLTKVFLSSSNRKALQPSFYWDLFPSRRQTLNFLPTQPEKRDSEKTQVTMTTSL